MREARIDQIGRISSALSSQQYVTFVYVGEKLFSRNLAFHGQYLRSEEVAGYVLSIIYILVGPILRSDSGFNIITIALGRKGMADLIQHIIEINIVFLGVHRCVDGVFLLGIPRFDVRAKRLSNVKISVLFQVPWPKLDLPTMLIPMVKLESPQHPRHDNVR